MSEPGAPNPERAAGAPRGGPPPPPDQATTALPRERPADLPDQLTQALPRPPAAAPPVGGDVWYRRPAEPAGPQYPGPPPRPDAADPRSRPAPKPPRPRLDDHYPPEGRPPEPGRSYPRAYDPNVDGRGGRPRETDRGAADARRPDDRYPDDGYRPRYPSADRGETLPGDQFPGEHPPDRRPRDYDRASGGRDDRARRDDRGHPDRYPGDGYPPDGYPPADYRAPYADRRPRRDDPGRSGPGYSGPAYPDPRSDQPGYADPRHDDPRYADPRHDDPRHADPRHADPRYADPRYDDPRYDDRGLPDLPPRDPRRPPPDGYRDYEYDYDPRADRPDERRPIRRQYDDRPYLDEGEYDQRGRPASVGPDGRPYPRAAEPLDYLPPDQPGNELEPVAPHQPMPRGSHLPPYAEPMAVTPLVATDGRAGPRKLTVTRVAALRSRQLTKQGVQLFRNATTADGAESSGLTHLTYAVMANYAVDAAVAVALANTLFFAAATAESTGKVLLYLLITVAPFAVIAPIVGPLLDRMQQGRRIALAVSSFGRAVLAVIMALQFNSWVLYPCALGMLVFSKSFGVLKAALTPRVLPAQITLVQTNSRLTVFGMLAGGVGGVLAAGLAALWNSPGALLFTAIIAVGGGVLCLRIPAWVESTEGEVPVASTGQYQRGAGKSFPVQVTTTLWANGVIRIETGFLALFIAFVVKSEYSTASGFQQLLLLGIIGVAAGIGGFLGNALGARLPLSKPEQTSIFALAAVIVSTVVALLAPGLATAAVVGLIGSTSSSLAKVCLDSVIQANLPEASRASAFGKSETVLQLSWVFGGVIGLLIGGVWSFGHSAVYSIGFGVVTALLVVGIVQCWLVKQGRSLVPAIPLFRPKAARAAARTRAAVAPPATTPQTVADYPPPPGPQAWSAVDQSAPPPTRPASAGRPDGPAPSTPPVKRKPRKAGDSR